MYSIGKLEHVSFNINLIFYFSLSPSLFQCHSLLSFKPNPATESISGGHSSRYRGALLHATSWTARSGNSIGAAADGAQSWYREAISGLQASAGYQDPAGDGDCWVQEAAGWRGWHVRADVLQRKLTLNYLDFSKIFQVNQMKYCKSLLFSFMKNLFAFMKNIFCTCCTNLKQGKPPFFINIIVFFIIAVSKQTSVKMWWWRPLRKRWLMGKWCPLELVKSSVATFNTMIQP